jgi:hypothetical protein
VARYSKLLGVAFLVLGFFVAFGISQALDNITPKFARMLGFQGAGALMAALDLSLRRIWGEGDGWSRYLVGSPGPAIIWLPGWAFGVLFALTGFAVIDP